MAQASSVHGVQEGTAWRRRVQCMVCRRALHGAGEFSAWCAGGHCTVGHAQGLHESVAWRARGHCTVCRSSLHNPQELIAQSAGAQCTVCRSSLHYQQELIAMFAGAHCTSCKQAGITTSRTRRQVRSAAMVNWALSSKVVYPRQVQRKHAPSNADTRVQPW